MNRVKTWKKFGKEIEKLPDGDRKIREVLQIEGYFFPRFVKRPPAEVYGISRQAEEIVRGAFTDVVGFESPRGQSPERK